MKNFREKVVLGPTNQFLIELGLLLLIEPDFLECLDPDDPETLCD
jgi:hypothetical protein